MLDKCDSMSYNYQSKIGYGILIQNVILKEIIILMGTSIVDIDIELKLETSRIKYLESRLFYFCYL